VILGDKRIDPETEVASNTATIYRYAERDRFVEFVLKRIRSLPHHATIAVITPTVNEAQAWFDLLGEDLNAYHRAALMSRRDDLTKRVNIHFTEVRETKGLEFDAIIVPSLDSFELGSPIGRNQAYVAITRAKHALMIGCATDHVDRPELELLEKSGLIIFRDVSLD
jgi:DNA helicase IV